MSTTYEQDFFTWTQEQAALLKERRLQLLDLDHLANEVADMGRAQITQFSSRLATVIGHLLKLMVQTNRTEANEKSWVRTIKEQRRRLHHLLDKNPGLKNPTIAEDALQDAWSDGLVLALRETGLDPDLFPETCPFTLEQLLGESTWPADGGEVSHQDHEEGHEGHQDSLP